MSIKFDGCINAYEARRDGSLDIHLETETPTATTDKYGNFFVRVDPADVERLMYAAIDALKKRRSTR